MAQIVIIEPHLLVRLGLTSLMACLRCAERITNQSYDELYRSPPSSAPTDIALISGPPNERINLLIQATRRAHSPKRIILMSDPPSLPTSWTNLPSIVVDYVSARASAETILSALQPHIQRQSSRSGPASMSRHKSEAAPATNTLPHQYSEAPYTEPDAAFGFKMDEARMLGISARQHEVLVLLAQGFPIKVICRQLNITMATTKGHIEALYQRLGVHNRNEAVFVAMAQGATLKMPSAAKPPSDARRPGHSGSLTVHLDPFSLRNHGE